MIKNKNIAAILANEDRPPKIEPKEIQNQNSAQPGVAILVLADSASLRLLGFFHAVKFIHGYGPIDVVYAANKLGQKLFDFNEGVVCIESANLSILSEDKDIFNQLYSSHIGIAVFSDDCVELILPKKNISHTSDFTELIVRLNSSDPLEIMNFITANHKVSRRCNHRPETLDTELPSETRTFLADHLTPRQKQVLWCVVNGYSVKEAAKMMGISPFTVRAHMSTISAKLGQRSKCELIKYGISLGLLKETFTSLNRPEQSTPSQDMPENTHDTLPDT